MPRPAATSTWADVALRYLLDTNVLSEPMRPAPDPKVMARIEAGGDTIVTASPVWHEIEFGRLRLPTGRRRRAIEAIIDALSIAAIAAVNDLVLVTRNVRDFSGFTGLEIESWFGSAAHG